MLDKREDDLLIASLARARAWIETRSSKGLPVTCRSLARERGLKRRVHDLAGPICRSLARERGLKQLLR